MSTLRNARDLMAAGLIEPAARDRVEAIQERYAIAITPAVQRLIRDAHRKKPARIKHATKRKQKAGS